MDWNKNRAQNNGANNNENKANKDRKWEKTTHGKKADANVESTENKNYNKNKGNDIEDRD